MPPRRRRGATLSLQQRTCPDCAISHGILPNGRSNSIVPLTCFRPASLGTTTSTLETGFMAEPRRSAGKDASDRAASDLLGARILIVEARFYEDIADALLAGATGALEKAGAAFDHVSVPGALEVAPAIAMVLDATERAGKPYEGAV